MADNATLVYEQPKTIAISTRATLRDIALQGGVRAVAHYSMALAQAPKEDLALERQAQYDQMDKDNREFTMLYGTHEPVIITVVARNSDGTVIVDANGNPVFEQVDITPGNKLINELNTPTREKLAR